MSRDENCGLPLRWDRMASMLAHEKWFATCGPHSIAAACGLSLDEVRGHLPGFRGWMNPTQVSAALASIGARCTLRKGMRARELAKGVNRLQWEGPWLDPARLAKEAYRHTHYVAHFGGWVLCTASTSAEWVSIGDWRAFLELRKSPWHVTHQWVMRAPALP